MEDAELVMANFLSAVSAHVISNGFLITMRVSLEAVCLHSFEVLNCWLNLVASCLDDENEIPLKVIAAFSASRFALPSIPLIVLHSLVRSVFWSMVSTVSPFLWYMHTDTVQVRWGLFYGGHLVCSSRPVSLMVQVPRGVSCRSVGMWCHAALSRIVRRIFSSLWQLVGSERLLGAPSTSSLYLSQLVFFRLT